MKINSTNPKTKYKITAKKKERGAKDLDRKKGNKKRKRKKVVIKAGGTRAEKIKRYKN